MKCIRFYRRYGGHVARVSDAEAARAVSDQKAVYCPRHWWRAAKLKGTN